jgi:hypothetical protein
MDLSKDMNTLAQYATSPIVERRPQLGDIIIHNYGALVYIGTIERFCTHDANMVEGPALVISSDNGKFYECQAAHYFDLRTCKVVSKPPVMPFEGEAVPEANIPAAAVAGVDDLIDIPEPHIGDGALEPSEETKRVVGKFVDVAKNMVDAYRAGVLGSNPDEVPF